MSQEKPHIQISPVKRARRRRSIVKVENPPEEVVQFSEYVRAELRNFKKTPNLVSPKKVRFLLEELGRCMHLLNPNQRDYTVHKHTITSQISQLQNYLKNDIPGESSSADSISQDIKKFKEVDTKRGESTTVTLDNVDPDTSLTGFNLGILTDNNFVTGENLEEAECREVSKSFVAGEILSLKNHEHNCAIFDSIICVANSNEAVVKQEYVKTPQKRKLADFVDDNQDYVTAANLDLKDDEFVSKHLVLCQNDTFKLQESSDVSNLLTPALCYENNSLLEKNRLRQDVQMDEDAESVNFLQPSISKSDSNRINPENDDATSVEEEFLLDIANKSLNMINEANKNTQDAGVEELDDDISTFLEKVEKLKVSKNFKYFKKIIYEEILPLFSLIKEDVLKRIDCISERQEASLDNSRKSVIKKKARINSYCFKEEDLLNMDEDESSNEYSMNDIKKLQEDFLKEFGNSFLLLENVKMDEVPDWRKHNLFLFIRVRLLFLLIISYIVKSFK